MSDQTTEALSGDLGSDSADPSMEDILASIRRIIADEGDDASASSAPDEHVNVQDFAVISPETADQNTVLVEAEAPFDVDTLNLEDILILSDDDFAAEDLEIPAMELLSEDVNDDLLIEADKPLVSETEINLLRGKDNLLDSTSEDMFLKPQSDPLIAVVEQDVSTIEMPQYMETDLREKIEFGNDIDLILDDGDENPFLSDHVSENESEILGIVEAGIADIQEREPQAPIGIFPDKNYAAIDIVNIQPPQEEALTTLSFDAGDDDVIDLVGDLLAKTESFDDLSEDTLETEFDEGLLITGDMSDIFDAKPVPENEIGPEIHAVPEIEAVCELVNAPDIDSVPEIDSMSGDEELDLVKALMADLTDDSLMDGEPSGDEIDIPTPVITKETFDPVLTSDDLEADLVDDILDMAIADELAIAEETAAQNERVATPEPIETLVSELVPTNDVLMAEEPLMDTEPTVTSDFQKEENADEGIESVDASINALLRIAAMAEQDAISTEDSITSSISDTAREDTVAIVDANALENTNAVLETEGVDMAFTPEASLEQDDIDSIISESLGERFDSVSSESNKTAFETILPESFDTKEILKDESDFVFAVSAPSELQQPFVELGAEPVTELADDPIEDDLLGEDIISKPTIHTPQTLEQEPIEMPKLVAKDGIIDDVTETATMEAFASLNQVVEENTEYQESGPRVGDLVQAALKPMLKEWLDDNLKGIVERAVTKEVKRISSGK